MSLFNSFLMMLVAINYACGNEYTYQVPQISSGANNHASATHSGWGSQAQGSYNGQGSRESSSNERSDYSSNTAQTQSRDYLQLARNRNERLREQSARQDRLSEERRNEARNQQNQRFREVEDRITQTHRQEQSDRNQNYGKVTGGTGWGAYQSQQSTYTNTYNGGNSGAGTSTNTRDFSRETLLNPRGRTNTEQRENSQSSQRRGETESSWSRNDGNNQNNYNNYNNPSSYSSWSSQSNYGNNYDSTGSASVRNTKSQSLNRQDLANRYSGLMKASADEVASLTGAQMTSSWTSGVCPEGQKYSRSQNCCVFESGSSKSSTYY